MDGAVQSLLEAIKSSDVVENRIQLLQKLSDSDLVEKRDVPSIVQCLTLWEDFTCLDVSQCMLNKSVLHVAVKCLDSDVSGSLEQFLNLSMKVSQWCEKHLDMSLMSTEDSQGEEHCNIFFRLLLDHFRFSVSILTAATKHNVVGNSASLVTVQKFVLALLSLTKEVISDAKKVDSFSAEMFKSAQSVTDSLVCLCKEYSRAVKWEVDCIESDKNREKLSSEDSSSTDLIISITALTVESLSELGIRAANGGGSLVAILNAAWKGVITLLQLGKQILASKVKVVDIILKLISLISESIRSVAEVWCSSLKEITVTEARRAFLPVKFYLINAVKLTLLFANQACVVYKDITLCILMISKIRFSLSQEILLKPAAEVMTDLLENLSIDLLNALINSREVKFKLKHEILDFLFTYENHKKLSCKDQSIGSRPTLLSEIFSEIPEAVTERSLLLGRVTLFLSLLKCSLHLEDDARLAVATKLRWLLNILTDEVVYANVLASHLPSVHVSAKPVEFCWDPMFSALVLALKTFMIVVSSSLSWEELETFLLENFLHPHFLCWEIVMELWSFLMRHAETEVVNGIVDKLCSMLKSLASPEQVLNPCSALRKMARSICMLLHHGKQSMVGWVYNSVLGDSSAAESSSDAGLALLLEGFPLNLLSGKVRNDAKRKIVSDYHNFLESFDGKFANDSRFGNFDAPVFALSACMRTLETGEADVDERTLKFVATVIQNYRNSANKAIKEKCCNLLSELLAIISNVDHLYTSNEMDDIIFGLRKLFISNQPASSDHLYRCKPSLALFMAGLSHIDMTENDDCETSCAVWDLYHMLLRERHWALVHLATTAFGYFCSRTTCNQLWRFVPDDAALAYDPASERDPDTARFMSELKAFLERERALVETTTSGEHELLEKDGKILQEIAQRSSSVSLEAAGFEVMDVDSEKQPNKRRKLPEGICDGVELLRKGLKAIGDGLTKWQPNHSDCLELHEKFSTQFSRIEEMVSHLVGLAHHR